MTSEEFRHVIKMYFAAGTAPHCTQQMPHKKCDSRQWMLWLAAFLFIVLIILTAFIPSNEPVVALDEVPALAGDARMIAAAPVTTTFVVRM